MRYSYTQLSRYLGCPRRCHSGCHERWADGEMRAGLLFGRAFENALAAYFRGEDAGERLFREWSQYKRLAVEYRRGDTWDRMWHEGVKLLELFAQHDRVHIANPWADQQVEFVRRLAGGSNFVAYVDALGEIDGTRAVIDWKTTVLPYPEEASGLLALDPQLACYSWMTGRAEVALVVFVRRPVPDIQYLRATIREEQRKDFSECVERMVSQIEFGTVPWRAGSDRAQNGCSNCSHLVLCVDGPQTTNGMLGRSPGGELAWIAELPE